MGKKKQNGQQNEWTDLWLKQSQLFQEITEEQLKSFFERGYHLSPEQHMGTIQAWLNALQDQWQFIPHHSQFKTYEKYTQLMSEMMMKASQLLIDRWTAVANTDKPINNAHDLYELWLSCCHDVYTEAAHSKAFQEAYGEWVNATIDFWQAILKK